MMMMMMMMMIILIMVTVNVMMNMNLGEGKFSSDQLGASTTYRSQERQQGFHCSWLHKELL